MHSRSINNKLSKILLLLVINQSLINLGIVNAAPQIPAQWNRCDINTCKNKGVCFQDETSEFCMLEPFHSICIPIYKYTTGQKFSF